jgi:hypothetical protein
MTNFQRLSKAQLIALVASYKGMETSLASMMSEARAHMKAGDPKAAFATISSAFECVVADMTQEQGAILEMPQTIEPGPCDLTNAQGDDLLQLQANYIMRQTDQINHLMAMIGEFGDVQTFMRAEFQTGLDAIQAMASGPSSDQSVN